MLMNNPLLNPVDLQTIGLFICPERISLAEVSNMENKTMFNVEVADQSGHSIVLMNQEEIANKAASDNSAWVFVNDQLVSAADIADMDLEEVERVKLAALKPTSLSLPVGEGDSEFGDLIEDSEAVVPADAVSFTLLQEQLHSLFGVPMSWTS